jgi:ribosomal-protein-alanine N-acetyltransferase
MVVRGPRLSLRYARPGDAEALYRMGADPEVVSWFSWGPYTDIAQAREFIDWLAAARASGERLEFVIAGEDDEPLGITGLSEFSMRDRRAVVGTWLGREHWGTGANRESKDLILALAFGPLGLLRVTAHAHPGNERSMRALDKMGFTAEGVLRGWHVHKGEQRDVAILRLMREDWSPGADVTFEGEPPAAFMGPAT